MRHKQGLGDGRSAVLRTKPLFGVLALGAAAAIAVSGCGDSMAARAKVPPKQHYKWPDTSPPCDARKPSCDDYDYFTRHATRDVPYLKKEVSPGHWQYAVDEEVVKFEAEDQRRRDDLLWALRTRVLTDKEMEEVRQYGDRLLVRNGQSFKEEEVSRELNDLLFQQFKLRAASGMSTGTEKTAKPVEGQRPASPVPKGDARH